MPPWEIARSTYSPIFILQVLAKSLFDREKIDTLISSTYGEGLNEIYKAFKKFIPPQPINATIFFRT